MTEKRYKSTVQRRKEEVDELKEQVRALQFQLDGLQPAGVVKRVATENAALSCLIRQQQLSLASAQGVFTPQLEAQSLHTPLFLRRDWEIRKATLLATRGTKFQAAYDYVMQRNGSLRGDQSLSDERVEMDNGDTCSAIFQTIHLPGASTVQQAYEAVLFAIDNAEISISERLGHVTVRDDYDGVDGKIFNARVVSTNDMGITTEVNCVMVSQLSDGSDGSFNGEPCGMILLDSVDEDERYPYSPSERVRKDVSVAYVVTKDKVSGQEQSVVTMRRAAFVKLHYPKFEISDAAWQDVQQDTALWGDVMTKSIRSVLYATP